MEDRLYTGKSGGTQAGFPNNHFSTITPGSGFAWSNYSAAYLTWSQNTKKSDVRGKSTLTLVDSQGNISLYGTKAVDGLFWSTVNYNLTSVTLKAGAGVKSAVVYNSLTDDTSSLSYAVGKHAATSRSYSLHDTSITMKSGSGMLGASSSVLLDNTTLSLYGESADVTWTLGTVSVASADSVLQTSNHSGVVTIAALDGSYSTSLLSASNSMKHTIFRVNGGDFSGDTLTFGITNTGSYRSAALELASKTVAEHSVINIRNSSSDEFKASMALAVNAETVKVAGIQDDTQLNDCDLSIISGTATNHTNNSNNTSSYGSSDTTYRTLEITGSGTQSTSAAVKGYVNISMTGSGSQSFTGDMSAFNGSLSVSAGSLNITDDVATASQINVSGGTLTFDGSVGAADSAAAPATVKGGKLEVKGTYYGSLTQQGGEAVIASLSGNGALKSSAGTATVSNATGFSGALEATGGSITVSSASSLSALKATNGSTLNAKGITAYNADTATGGLSVSELVIGTGSKVQAWGSGDTWSASAEATVLLEKGADGAPVTLTVGTAGQTGTSTLNANLVLDGATVTLNNALTMGSTLTLNGGITLSGDLLSRHIKGGEEIALFTGVDSLTLGTGMTYTADQLTGDVMINSEDVFINVKSSDFKLSYGADGIVALVAQRDVPEPTTATLSLLALMGLAARRRRRKA